MARESFTPRILHGTDAAGLASSTERMRWLTLPVLVAALLVAVPEARAEYEALEPFDAIGYKRGRKLKLKLVQIGWAAVEINTAKAFLAMREAALADGVELYIRSGFRD